MRRLVLPVLLAAAAAALCAPGTSAVAAPAGTEPVGGALLGTRGVVVAAGAPALPKGISAASWVVADLDTGDVLGAKAPHVRHLPASTLKLLTAVTLLPRLDPAARVVATNADAGVDGSKVGLVPHQSYTIASLFTAMLMVSGNDAAMALADAAGGPQQTVTLMNAQAHHLQADDTVAGTPSGLDSPGESSSAYDLALVARAGFGLPAFGHYLSLVRGTMPAPHGKHFEIYTHNRLLTTYRGAVGGKNGYTVKADATYVGVARRGGHTLVVTLMRAQPLFWHEAAALLDWGFAADGRGDPVGRLVDPLQPPAPVTVDRAAPARAAVRLASHSGSDDVPVIAVVALAASAAVAVVVSGRRWRRRHGRRLTLPPF